MKSSIMNEELTYKEPAMSESNDRKSFSFEKNKDGVEIRVTGRKVENGWVVNISKEWKNENDEYKYESKEYISVKNPLENVIKKPEKSKKDDKVNIGSVIAGMMNESNTIIV